jgi:hypothetical protein
LIRRAIKQMNAKAVIHHGRDGPDIPELEDSIDQLTAKARRRAA